VNIAFYAPLKAPDHPVPSGDRALANALLDALRLAGHRVTLASRFRSFDPSGDAQRQVRLARIGERVAQRFVARCRDANAPRLWFTYHLHHKAPDHVGPFVTRALRIPYVVAEASIAPKQRDGAWAFGYAAAHAAIGAADTVVFVNPSDIAQVRRARGTSAPFAMLAPFIDVARFAGSAPASRAALNRPPRIVTVAMMRDGAKLASYRLLADALRRIDDIAFELTIVGDGPARAAVASAFAPLASRVTFAGALPPAAIAEALRASDLFVWPAIDEAIGLVFVEAQACGLPVVGGGSAGVAAVVEHGRTGLLTAEGDIAAFVAATRSLLTDAPLRDRFSAEAGGYVRARHDLPAAAQALDAVLRNAVARRRVVALTPSG